MCSKNLLPSEIIIAKSAMQICTILGSCVAVCLWDSTRGYGGMNHFMLPYWNGDGLASPKFGNIAMANLLAKMLNLGCEKQHLQAKIFGGGDLLQFKNNYFNVGERNIQCAKVFLAEQKIRIVSGSTGGKTGRKIIFDTDSGTVYMRIIKGMKSVN